MKKKIAIITGITGQDGSYLAELLIKKNYTVHGLLRRTSFLNLDRIQELISRYENLGIFNLHYIDMIDTSSILSLVKKIKPDEFYNLAAMSHVGISFYTFQTLSYSIDVYKNKMAPTKDIISFFAFVSFFPQLVAGPIERAKNLLPQFYKKRTFEYERSIDGMRQILWGLFKKIVIADSCSIYVNDIFTNYANYSGSTLLLGTFFFAFQIYHLNF